MERGTLQTSFFKKNDELNECGTVAMPAEAESNHIGWSMAE